MNERADIIRDAEGFEVPDIHSSSVAYAGRFSGSVGDWMLQVQSNATKDLFPTRCTRILDAGGGHGQNLEVFKSLSAKATILGSDESCKELIKTSIESGSVDFAIGPLTKIPFADRNFDCSLSYRMLTHLVDWKGHLAELCRISDKTVLVEYPVNKGFNSLSSLLFAWKKNIEKNTRPYTLFENGQIDSELYKWGFEMTARRAQYFWPMALHRMHKNSTLASFFEWLPRVVGLTQVFGSPVIARFDRKVD